MLMDGERLIPKQLRDNLGKGRCGLEGTEITCQQLKQLSEGIWIIPIWFISLCFPFFEGKFPLFFLPCAKRGAKPLLGGLKVEELISYR